VTQVAVVGAGITGLAAAWELKRGGVEPVVLESEPRPGGAIITERRDGFLIEGGPDGFLAAELEIPKLADEVGIADRLVGQLARGSFLWTGRALEPLEEGRAAALLGIEGQPTGALSQGFMSFGGGMGEIVAALVDRLGTASLRTTAAVTGVVPSGAGYRVTSAGGMAIEVDGVILAAQAWTMARVLESLDVEPARRLNDDVVYWPSVTVSLAYGSDQVRVRLQGTGFVAGTGPTDSPLRACTYASLKYPGRAPSGGLLLRAFLQTDEQDAGAIAHGALAPILEIAGAPRWTRSFCRAKALPRYKAPHADRVAAIRTRVRDLPPLALAGAALDGAGVSACVRSGRAAARSILERLAA
jgi:oxygen-dependent protoporphyrinogen oxidase